MMEEATYRTPEMENLDVVIDGLPVRFVSPWTRWRRRLQVGGTRALIRVGSALLPGLMARIAEQLFLTPPRYRRPDRERAWLHGAETFDFEVRGKRARGWTWGDGPVVLLVHGWAGRGSQMGAFAAPLVAAGYRVVAFDAPGHGDSEGKQATFFDFTDTALAMQERFGPFHAVIAHSFGGPTVGYAMKLGLSVKRAVFIGPGVSFRRGSRSFARRVGTTLRVLERMQRRLERRFGVTWDDLELLEIARDMSVPLLVFHDRGDREVSYDGAEELVGNWPEARLRTTTGLGHRRVLRDPGVVGEAVAFVDQAPGAGHAGAAV